MNTNNIADLIREEIACIVADSASNAENLNEDGSINWDFVNADVHIELFDAIDRFVPAELTEEANNIADEMINIWFESAVDDYLEMIEG